jgi:hypothetical protein
MLANASESAFRRSSARTYSKMLGCAPKPALVRACILIRTHPLLLVTVARHKQLTHLPCLPFAQTSASMLTWSTYELSRNPEVMAKLLAEGRTVFTNGARVPGARGAAEFEGVALPPRAELERLVYTVNVLKESLRLYTLVPVVSRVCVEDDVLGDQAVPAGTKIFLLVKAVHMDPDLWPEPEAFRPERFEKEFDM